MSNTAAARVRELRKTLKLSLEKFANETDISFSHLSKAETGAVPVTSEMLEKISNRWKVPFNWLSKGEGQLTFEKNMVSDKRQSDFNPAVDTLYLEMREQIAFYRDLIKQITGGKSFRTALNAPGFPKRKSLRAAA